MKGVISKPGPFSLRPQTHLTTCCSVLCSCTCIMSSMPIDIKHFFLGLQRFIKVLVRSNFNSWLLLWLLLSVCAVNFIISLRYPCVWFLSWESCTDLIYLKRRYLESEPARVALHHFTLTLVTFSSFYRWVMAYLAYGNTYHKSNLILCKT